jgi:hypothetical protein
MHDLPHESGIRKSRSKALPGFEELQHDLRARSAPKCNLRDVSQADEPRRRAVHTIGSRRSYNVLSMSYTACSNERARYFLLRHLSQARSVFACFNFGEGVQSQLRPRATQAPGGELSRMSQDHEPGCSLGTGEFADGNRASGVAERAELRNLPQRPTSVWYLKLLKLQTLSSRSDVPLLEKT